VLVRQVLGAISQYAVITTVAQLIKALRRDQFDNASNEDRLSHGLSTSAMRLFGATG
jgi:hypothetical protein